MNKNLIVFIVMVSGLVVQAADKPTYKMPPCSIDRITKIKFDEVKQRALSGYYEVENSKTSIVFSLGGTGVVDVKAEEGVVTSRVFAYSQNQMTGEIEMRFYRVQDKAQTFNGPLANTVQGVLKCVSGEMKCQAFLTNRLHILSEDENRTLVSIEQIQLNADGDETRSHSQEILIKN